MITSATPWRVAGTYLEACNCEAVCPCRRQGDRSGGLSSYGVCDFALSWRILEGFAGELDLSNLDVVLAGTYADDPQVRPDVALEEWAVALYIDATASDEQAAALEAIFLGRAGGDTFGNFAAAIGDVHAVRRARIDIDHTPAARRFSVEDYVVVHAPTPVSTDEPVSCGIPGHDHPGTELIAEVMRVDEDPLVWDVTGRCGFESDFDYRSDGAAAT